jgi:RNA polymerase sigma-70 factor (ECF subfamily)
MTPNERQVRMRTIVQEHNTFIARVLEKAGVPQAELDDAIQRTFITVTRRLDDVHAGSEKSFVFQVALNVAAHARRNLARRREVCSDQLDDVVIAPTTPEHIAERKEMRKLIDDIVASMGEPLRSVFVLNQFDAMSMGEIAGLLGVPIGTVASRLRRAREVFRRHIMAIELAADLGAEGATRTGGPSLLRRERASALVRALLSVGVGRCASASTRTKTLAALGLRVAARRERGGLA